MTPLSNIEHPEGRSMHVVGLVDGLRRDLDEAEQARDAMRDELIRIGQRLAGAVEALREIKRVAAIEAPPVSDEVPAKVWKLAFDALNAIGGQS